MRNTHQLQQLTYRTPQAITTFEISFFLTLKLQNLELYFLDVLGFMLVSTLFFMVSSDRVLVADLEKLAIILKMLQKDPLKIFHNRKNFSSPIFQN